MSNYFVCNGTTKISSLQDLKDEIGKDPKFLEYKNCSGKDLYQLASEKNLLDILIYLEKEHNWDVSGRIIIFLTAIVNNYHDMVEHLCKKYVWKVDDNFTLNVRFGNTKTKDIIKKYGYIGSKDNLIKIASDYVGFLKKKIEELEKKLDKKNNVISQIKELVKN